MSKRLKIKHPNKFWWKRLLKNEMANVMCISLKYPLHSTGFWSIWPNRFWMSFFIFHRNLYLNKPIRKHKKKSEDKQNDSNSNKTRNKSAIEKVIFKNDHCGKWRNEYNLNNRWHGRTNKRCPQVFENQTTSTFHQVVFCHLFDFEFQRA